VQEIRESNGLLTLKGPEERQEKGRSNKKEIIERSRAANTILAGQTPLRFDSLERLACDFGPGALVTSKFESKTPYITVWFTQVLRPSNNLVWGGIILCLLLLSYYR